MISVLHTRRVLSSCAQLLLASLALLVLCAPAAAQGKGGGKGGGQGGGSGSSSIHSPVIIAYANVGGTGHPSTFYNCGSTKI